MPKPAYQFKFSFYLLSFCSELLGKSIRIFKPLVILWNKSDHHIAELSSYTRTYVHSCHIWIAQNFQESLNISFYLLFWITRKVTTNLQAFSYFVISLCFYWKCFRFWNKNLSLTLPSTTSTLSINACIQITAFIVVIFPEMETYPCITY